VKFRDKSAVYEWLRSDLFKGGDHFGIADAISWIRTRLPIKSRVRMRMSQVMKIFLETMERNQNVPSITIRNEIFFGDDTRKTRFVPSYIYRESFSKGIVSISRG